MDEAIVAAVGAVLAALITALDHRRNKKLDEIHVLVNSQMTSALQEIANLKAILADSTSNATTDVEEHGHPSVP